MAVPENWHMRNGRNSTRAQSAFSDHGPPQLQPGDAEDLHAWSIYRQNLNSDFTDSALGSADKSALPFGDFRMRESTMQSILNNPKYGPKSELGTNMFTYLKFGLPRVLPPGRDDISSDSPSTDEEVAHGGRRPAPTRNRLRSARSEDFLDRVVERQERGSYDGVRRYASRDQLPRISHRNQRSVSEANLLSSDYYSDHQDIKNIRRSLGVGKEGYDNNAMEGSDRTQQRMRKTRDTQQRGLRSRAASQLSLASRQSKPKQGGISYRHQTPMLNDKYFPKDNFANLGDFDESDEVEGFKYPHLQLRNISYSERKGRKEEVLLDMIDMEARGGDLVAVLSSQSISGTAFCSVLANRHAGIGTRLSGDIIINGINVPPSRLADRVAFVEQDVNFSPDMSVRQTILFQSFMREPGTLTRRRDNKGRIDALIEDLGLSQVRHTRIADLTQSEKLRLNVACHLLLDTDIVLLDQPTQGMDIFDTFFLVEYLRQWAARGRIVILTIQPPTYEIFTMFSKVLLLSCGRLMYFGKRREMLPYFTLIEYPCPAYKNPSDYYMDLVTLDDLSPEAMLESRQRVEHLCAVYQNRRETLSDPGPPGIMPPKIRRANFIKQIFGLWIRALIYRYPFNVINWVQLVLLSGTMSVCIGGVFSGMRWRYWDRAWQQDPSYGQENASDRLGFQHVMMTVGVWPMLLSLATGAWKSKPALTRDVDDRLYSRMVFGISQAMYSAPAVVGEIVAYTVPAYLLAGIHYRDSKDLDSFYTYIGFMLLYMLSIHILTNCVSHTLPSRHLTAILVGFIFLCQVLVAGYAIHIDDLAIYVSWLRYISPPAWMSRPILEGELLVLKTLHCPNNPMVTDEETGIIKQVACGLANGKEALMSLSLPSLPLPLPSISDWDHHLPLIATALLLMITLVLTLLSLIVIRQRQRRKNKTTQS